jgi:hypothetical protein
MLVAFAVVGGVAEILDLGIANALLWSRRGGSRRRLG